MSYYPLGSSTAPRLLPRKTTHSWYRPQSTESLLEILDEREKDLKDKRTRLRFPHPLPHSLNPHHGSHNEQEDPMDTESSYGGESESAAESGTEVGGELTADEEDSTGEDL